MYCMCTSCTKTSKHALVRDVTDRALPILPSKQVVQLS